jgi:integrase
VGDALFLLTLFSTGMRRGKLLGLRWEDIDFDSCRISIQRARVRGRLTTPKNGKGRQIAMPPGFASALEYIRKVIVSVNGCFNMLC